MSRRYDGCCWTWRFSSGLSACRCTFHTSSNGGAGAPVREGPDAVRQPRASRWCARSRRRSTGAQRRCVARARCAALEAPAGRRHRAVAKTRDGAVTCDHSGSFPAAGAFLPAASPPRSACCPRACPGRARTVRASRARGGLAGGRAAAAGGRAARKLARRVDHPAGPIAELRCIHDIHLPLPTCRHGPPGDPEGFGRESECTEKQGRPCIL
jgi:hypothetical protein